MKQASTNPKMLLVFPYLVFIIIMFAGCSPAPQATPTLLPVGETPTSIPTLVPTATELPAALLVNGQAILLEEYEIESALLQAANEEMELSLSADEIKQMVIDELIGQALLAQAAFEAGFELTEDQEQTYFQELIQEAGGEAAYAEWLEKYNFTQGSINQTVSRQLAGAWQIQQLVDQFPDTAPQVHLRQMLLYDFGTAQDAYSRLQSGTDFETLAKFYDPQTGGELGWIPQGYLTQPEVEIAAFELTPGEYSEIIESNIGYHIIKVEEREEDRPLTGEARQILLHKYIDQWISEHKVMAEIVINLP